MTDFPDELQPADITVGSVLAERLKNRLRQETTADAQSREDLVSPPADPATLVC